MYTGGRTTCGGGGGHATCVLEVGEVVFHVVEVKDDMGRVLEVAEGLGRGGCCAMYDGGRRHSPCVVELVDASLRRAYLHWLCTKQK